MAQEHVIVHLCPQAVGFPIVIGIDVHPVVDADHQVLFVDHLPVLDPVAKCLEADPCIALKRIGAGAIFPAVVLFHQGVGQVKVIEGHQGLDALLDEVVNHLLIEGNAFGVHIPIPIGNDAGPGQGEPVRLQAQLFHQVNVFFPVMVEVAGDGGVSLFVRMLEGVEIGDGHTLAAFIPAALNLKSGGRCSPEEMIGKVVHNSALLCRIAAPGGRDEGHFWVRMMEQFRSTCSPGRPATEWNSSELDTMTLTVVSWPAALILSMSKEIRGAPFLTDSPSDT